MTKKGWLVWGLLALFVVLACGKSWAGCNWEPCGSAGCYLKDCSSSYCPSGAGYSFYKTNYLYKCWYSGGVCYARQVAYCTGSTSYVADSLNCVSSGKDWKNGGCVNCTERDSTWSECRTTYHWDLQEGVNKPYTGVFTTRRVNCETTQDTALYAGKTCEDVLKPDSSDVKCMGSYGEFVTLENGRGQTWRCRADGDCNLALTKYALGQCPSPYGSSSSADSSELGGGGGSPSSSSSGLEVSSSSTGLDTLPNNLDFIKDSFFMVDTNFLKVRENQEMQGALQNHLANNTDELLINSYDVKELLRQINNKEINVNVPKDTNIVNVSVNVQEGERDTVIVNFPNDTLPSQNIGLPDSVKEMAGQVWQYAKDAFLGFDDYDSTKPEGGYITDEQKRALDSEIQQKIDGILSGDSGNIKAVKDSAFGIMNKLNIMKLPGNSGGCPAVLSQEVIFSFPFVGDVTAPPLGNYLCTPVGFLSVSLWQIGKVLVRLVVSVLCMFFLFKCATGTLKEE